MCMLLTECDFRMCAVMIANIQQVGTYNLLLLTN